MCMPVAKQGQGASGDAMNLLLGIYTSWAARYNTWLLIKLTSKGVVFSFCCFAFLPFLFCSWTYLLNDVQEDLILLIPQIVLSPANCSCHLHMQTHGLQMYRRHIHTDNVVDATLLNMCICYFFNDSATTT